MPVLPVASIASVATGASAVAGAAVTLPVALSTVSLAMEPAVHSREQAQAWLRLQGYEPAVLRLGPLTRLGGRMTAANVAFDDHPNEKRFSDRIETVTADSVFAWLARSGLGSAPVRLQ